MLTEAGPNPRGELAESSDPSLEVGLRNLEENLLGIGDEGVRWLAPCDREVMASELQEISRGLRSLGKDLAPWRFHEALLPVEDDLRTVSDGLMVLADEIELWARWTLLRPRVAPPVPLRHVLLHATSLFDGAAWKRLPSQMRVALTKFRELSPDEALAAARSLKDALANNLPQLRDMVAQLQADLVQLRGRHLAVLSGRPAPILEPPTSPSGGGRVTPRFRRPKVA